MNQAKNIDSTKDRSLQVEVDIPHMYYHEFQLPQSRTTLRQRNLMVLVASYHSESVCSLLIRLDRQLTALQRSMQVCCSMYFLALFGPLSRLSVQGIILHGSSKQISREPWRTRIESFEASDL